MTGIFDWGISNCQDRLRVTPLKTNVEPRNSRKVPRANFWVFHWWRCDLQIHDFGDLNTKNADLITVIRRAERQCAFGMAMLSLTRHNEARWKVAGEAKNHPCALDTSNWGFRWCLDFPKSHCWSSFSLSEGPQNGHSSPIFTSEDALLRNSSLRKRPEFDTLFQVSLKKNCFVEGSKVCQPCLAKWLASIRSAGAGWSHDGRWPSSTTMPPHGKNWAF
jgi:hypothetical protein